jgi:DNA-directed RNA polymerase specialized sigma24 family protein
MTTEGGSVVAKNQRVEDLEQFLAQRGRALLRTAVLLAGSLESGEDLLQTAIERLLRQRHRLNGDPEGYLRRTLYNLATDGYRRQGLWRRKLRILQTEAPTSADVMAEVDLRTRWCACSFSCRPSSARSWCCATGSS